MIVGSFKSSASLKSVGFAREVFKPWSMGCQLGKMIIYYTQTMIIIYHCNNMTFLLGFISRYISLRPEVAAEFSSGIEAITCFYLG